MGPTFRVEQAKNGEVTWSEHNPLYVLYAAPSGSAVSLFDVTADNPAEETEGEAYLRAAFLGQRDVNSGLHAYILGHAQSVPELAALPAQLGAGVDLGCAGRLYVRAGNGRLFMLQSTRRSNAYEYDPHPVLYFSVLAPAPPKSR